VPTPPQAEPTRRTFKLTEPRDPVLATRTRSNVPRFVENDHSSQQQHSRTGMAPRLAFGHVVESPPAAPPAPTHLKLTEPRSPVLRVQERAAAPRARPSTDEDDEQSGHASTNQAEAGGPRYAFGTRVPTPPPMTKRALVPTQPRTPRLATRQRATREPRKLEEKLQEEIDRRLSRRLTAFGGAVPAARSPAPTPSLTQPRTPDFHTDERAAVKAAIAAERARVEELMAQTEPDGWSPRVPVRSRILLAAEQAALTPPRRPSLTVPRTPKLETAQRGSERPSMGGGSQSADEDGPHDIDRVPASHLRGPRIGPSQPLFSSSVRASLTIPRTPQLSTTRRSSVPRPTNASDADKENSTSSAAVPSVRIGPSQPRLSSPYLSKLTHPTTPKLMTAMRSRVPLGEMEDNNALDIW
jgi:hypothetical protein